MDILFLKYISGTGKITLGVFFFFYPIKACNRLQGDHTPPPPKLK